MGYFRILGHKTRYKEVERLLRQFGGTGGETMDFSNDEYLYYVNYDSKIHSGNINDTFEHIQTLEEFEAKYPFKVGDEVYTNDGHKCKILNILWMDDTVLYLTDFCCGYAMYVNEFDKEKPKKETNMTNFGIIGEYKRSNEILDILSGFGGINRLNLVCEGENNFYYIRKDKIIDCESLDNEGNNIITFTLDEFKKSFPFKLGDRVVSNAGNSLVINRMKWEDGEVYYGFVGYMTYLRATNLSFEKLNNIELTPTDNNDGTIKFEIPKGYKIVSSDERSFTIGKIKYPRTILGCVDVLGIKLEEAMPKFINVEKSHAEALSAFSRVFIARNAWFKVAGYEVTSDNLDFPDPDMKADFEETFKEDLDKIRFLL